MPEAMEVIISDIRMHSHTKLFVFVTVTVRYSCKLTRPDIAIQGYE